MALSVLYFAYLFSFVLLALFVQNITKKKNYSTYNIAPGPRKLPIIGNIHNLLSSQPPRKLRDLAKKYGPVMHLQLGEVSAIIISSPESASEVMKTHDIHFSTRPEILATQIMSYNCTSIAFAPYGNYWRQLRKICQSELLSLKRVISYQPIREEVLSNLVKSIASQNGSPINFTEAAHSAIYTIVSGAAFGKCKDQEKFISVVKQAVKVAGGFDLGDLFPSAKWIQNVTGLRSKLESLHQQSDKILENIINEHKEKRCTKAKDDQGDVQEDLVDVLLYYEDGSNKDFSLRKDNIKAIILDIFGAGGESSADTIDWAMVEMIRDPRIMKKAQDEVREVFKMKGRVEENYMNELNYLKSVIKETLRVYPPLPLLLPRECRQACEINGYHIPLKTKVIVNAWAIGRDPNYWNEPDRFYPERFIDSTIGSSFEYIPFGAGRRICPGNTFGLRSVELVLATLLYHFDWKLPSGMRSEDMDMTEEFGIASRRKDDLLLLPSVYHPLHFT